MESGNFTPPLDDQIKENIEIGDLEAFDLNYFKQLEGEDGWIAIGPEDYKKDYQNQKYFTICGLKGEKLGIVGVYDIGDEKNIIHTVIDPRYRGKRLASKAKLYLMEKLDLPFITFTIDLNNKSSISAAEKMPGIKKVSDEQYEKEFHKMKYIYEKPRK